MAAFVLDASVAISWCFPGDPTEDTSYRRRILKELAVNDAIVPEIWAFEIAHSIFVSFSKRKRISEGQIDEDLGLLNALPIRVEPQALWSNVGLESLARRISRRTTQLIWTWHCAPISRLQLRTARLGGLRSPKASSCLTEESRAAGSGH